MTKAHRHSSHSHTHGRPQGMLGWLRRVFHLGEHERTPLAGDDAFQSSAEGIRTVWLALLALGVTSAVQAVIVVLSGSVALLADTVHNIGDTINSIPLLIAFYLGRRLATRRYTYGFGRAEDVAGVFIVLSIAVSAGIVFWESFHKLLNPQPMQHIGWVAVAAIVGFLGNEAVALLQIRAGRRIGSEAMIADGLHARIDGLTSLAVLIAAGGTALGLPILDPLIGLLIGLVILFITRDAARRIWYRLMDAVDPGLITQIEHHAGETDGVKSVASARARWLGHRLVADVRVVVEETLSLAESCQIARHVERRLRQAIPHLDEAAVQTLPTYAVEDDRSPIPSDASYILPPRYHLSLPSAAPMEAASLKLDEQGNAAWDEIWTDFCDLALAGGPPHRGRLLEPGDPQAAAAAPDSYARVLHELERGIRMVTGLDIVRCASPGWIGMRCTSEEMALWLLRAIVVENVSVRREGTVLYVPASPHFTLEREIRNVITVIAKTHHYWQEHSQQP